MSNSYYISAGTIPIDNSSGAASNSSYISAGLTPNDVASGTSFTDNLNLWQDSFSLTPPTTTAFTYETWLSLRNQLANRLHDPDKIFWTDCELKIYLTEAFRTFSFLTAYWRAQGSFYLTPGVSFYDITQELPRLLDRTVVDRDLISTIEYHFQEDPTTDWPSGWTGTAMFTMDDIAHALQKRRNQFLAETGVLVTRTVGSSGLPSGGRISLADDVLDVRRLAWTNIDGTINNLWRTDEQELTSFTQTWTTPAVQDPTDYSVMSPPPITVQLSPAPSNPATMDLLTISAGEDFTPTTVATLVGVPDDMTWIVKWGAMADLLMIDGPAQDPQRAAYCEARFKHGVQLARQALVITAARLTA